MKRKNIYTISGILITIILIFVIINSMSGSENDNIRINDELSQSEMEGLISKLDFGDGEVNLLKVEKADLIEDIEIDKNRICSGEDFKITVVAQGIDGTSTNLTYQIGTQKGNPAILKYNFPGEEKIHVFVKDKALKIDYRVIDIDVEDCPDRPKITIKSTANNTIPHQIDYEVTNMDGLGENCTYEWDFGDGKTGRTDTGYVSHNYGDRKQDKYSSTFITAVEVTDENNVTAKARISVTLPNIDFLSSRMGSITIPAIYNRFPSIDGDTYTVKIKFNNIFKDTVRFTDANVTYLPCSHSKEEQTGNYRADTFISNTSINSGQSSGDTITFNRTILPESTCTMNIQLVGVLGRTRPVTSSIYLTIPMSKQDIQKAIAEGKIKVIKDQSIVEKVQRAKIILGSDIVTPADIRRLEIEGKL